MSACSPEQMRALAHREDAALSELKDALRAAADEVDRLRAVIENAPHAPKCVHYAAAWQTIGEPCTCWKADVL